MASVAHTPFVSVIIPTYNRAALLPSAIDSFLTQSYPPERFEIIVCDNNSSDDTERIVTGYCGRYSNVRYLFEKRQGAHFARNTAAKTARGDILYFTDDDMLAHLQLLEEIVKVFDLDPLIGTATGLIEARFDAPPPRWVEKYMINELLSVTRKDAMADRVVSRSDFGVWSCHQAVRRDAFFQAGGFNPDYVLDTLVGDGETGLNIKLMNKGYKFAFSARSIIYHKIPESRTTLRYLVNRSRNEGMRISYTNYREHRTAHKIIPPMIKRNSCGLVLGVGHTLLKIAAGRLSWHFLPAKLAFYHGMNKNDLKLLTNGHYRALAETDDWLGEAHP